MAGMGRHNIGLPPQFAAAFSFSRKLAVCLTFGKGLQTMPLLINPVSTASAFSQAARNITRVASEKPFGDACFSTKNVGVTRLGYAVPEIQLLLYSNDVVWRIFRANSMVSVSDDVICLGFVDGINLNAKDQSTLQYTTVINQRTPLVPASVVFDLGGRELWVDCDKYYVTSTYQSPRCNYAEFSRAGSTTYGTCFSPPRPGLLLCFPKVRNPQSILTVIKIVEKKQFQRLKINASIGFGGTKISSVNPYTVLESSIYKAFTSEFVKQTAARNITRVASEKPFGDACFSTKNVAVTRLGYAVPEIQLLLHSNDVVWRIFRAISMVSVSDDVICLGFVDGVNLCDYVSSTYQSPRCNYAKCSRAGSTSCGTCFSPPRPGCVTTLAAALQITNFIFDCGATFLLKGLASGTVGMAGMGRHNIGLPPQFAAAFSFSQKFAVCQTSGKGLQTMPLLINPFQRLKINASIGFGGTKISSVNPYTVLESSIYKAFTLEFVKQTTARNITRVASEKPFGDACFSTKNVGVTPLGYAAPEIQVLLRSNDVVWRIFRANSMTTSLTLTNLLVATTASAHAPAPPAVAHVSLLPDLAVVTTLAAALQITNFIFDCGATFLLKGLASGTVVMAGMGRHIIGLPPQFAAAFIFSQKFAVCLSSGKGLQTMPLLINPESTASAFSQESSIYKAFTSEFVKQTAARNITREASEKPFGDACFSTKNVAVTRLGYAVPEIQLLLHSNDVVWRIFRAISMTTSLPLTNILVATTPSAHASAPPPAAHVSLLPDLAVVTTLAAALQITNFIFDCGATFLLKGLASGTVGMAGMGRHNIGLPPQFAAAFSFSRKLAVCLTFGKGLQTMPLLINPFQRLKINASIGFGGTKISSVNPYTVLESSIYKAFTLEFVKQTTARNITRVASEKPFGDACFSTKNVGVTRLGYAAPEIQVLLRSNDVVWRIFRANSMQKTNLPSSTQPSSTNEHLSSPLPSSSTSVVENSGWTATKTTSLPLTNILVATTPSAHASAPPPAAHVSLLPDLAVVTTLAAALQITNFIFDCGATFLLKGLASGTVGMAGMGRHNIGLPPQFAAAFSFSRKLAVCLTFGKGLQTMPLLINPFQRLKINASIGFGGTKISSVNPYTVLESSIYKAFTLEFVKQTTARNITRVASEKPFGDACFSTKNVGVTRLGYAAPEIQVLLRSNDVVWRIFRANSMVSVSDDVICLGFVDGVNLNGVHIDCTVLVLFIFSPSSSAQPSFRPKALLLPIAKDQSTLQYTTVINQRTPLVPTSVVFDLGGRELWVDCDKYYVSSTYQSPRCNYAKCSHITKFIFDCGATFLLKGLASRTVGMARMGRHIIGLPPQFAAAFSFSQKFAVCLSSGKGLQTIPLLINPVSTASAFSQAARNITRVASEKLFGDACFSTKNVGVTRLGYAAPEIQLLLCSNDVVWRIFRANSMVSVSDDVTCLGFVDGVNLCGVHIDCTVLVLFIFSPSSSAQPSFRPKALLLPVAKDQSTLQYTTVINQHIPLVPASVVFDLGGRELWVDCDKDYVSSTYQSTRCNYAECSRAGSTSCGTCFSPPRPGCRLASGTVGMARMGRHIIGLPPQFAAAFSFSQKFAVCLSSGKGLQTIPLLINPVSTASAFSQAARNITRVASEKLFGDACFSTKNVGVTRLGYAAPEIQLLLCSNDVVWRIFRANSMTTSLPLTNLLVATTPSAHAPAPPAVAHVSLLPDLAVVTTLAAALQITNFIFDCGATFLLKGLASGTVGMARMGRHIIGLPPQFAAAFSFSQKFAVCLSSGKGLQTIPLLINPVSTASAFSQAARNITRVASEKLFGDACFSTKNVGVTRLGYAAPEIQLLLCSNDVVWRIFRANSMVSVSDDVICLGFVDGVNLCGVHIDCTVLVLFIFSPSSSAQPSFRPKALLLPVAKDQSTLQYTTFINQHIPLVPASVVFDLGGRELWVDCDKDYVSSTYQSPRCNYAECSRAGSTSCGTCFSPPRPGCRLASGTVGMAGMGRHIIGLPPQFAAAFSFSQKFSVCLSSGKGLQTMPLLINPVSTASAFSQGVHIDCTVLVLFIFSPSSSAQPSFRPKALLLPVAKDQSTLQYTTVINQHIPLVPASVVFDLGGRELWVDCDKDYVSSTYQSPRCNYAECSRAGSTSCGTCFSPPRPGCRLASGTVGMARMGRHIIGLPPQFAAAFSFSQKFAVCLSSGKGLQTIPLLINPVSTASAFSQAARNITRVASEKLFGDACFSTKNVGVTRLGYAAPEIQLLLCSNDVVWRIFRANSMVSVSDDVICLGFVDGVNLCGVHIDCTVLVLFIFSPSSSAQPSFRPKALLLPVAKDQSTLQYTTFINQHIPLVPASVVFDLGGRELWVDCDKDYVSSTYQSPRCNYAECSRAGSTSCGTCFSPPRPGCRLASGTVGMAGMGRHIIGLPPQFAAAFSFSQKFSVCLSSGKGLQTMPLLINPVSTASAFSQGVHIDCTVLVLFIFSPSSSAQPSFRPKALLLPVAKDQSTLQYTTTTSLPLTNLLVATTPSAHAPAPPAVAHVSLLPDLAVVTTLAAALQITNFIFDCGATFLLKGLASGTVGMAGMGRHIIGFGGTKISSVNPYTVLESSIYKAFTSEFVKQTAARNITRVASEKPFGDACFSTKNVAVTRLGYAAPEIQLLLHGNDVVWRIFRANSMVSVSDDVICLGFVDGVNLCGVHIDCTILVLFIFSPSSSAQPSFRPKALLLPVAKDQSTLQYTTVINQHIPLVPASVVFDLAGRELWVDCDKDYVSSTYQSPRCNYAECSRAGSTSCGTCFSPPRPGCRLASGTVGMARMGRHIIGLPAQFAAAFSFSQKFAVCLSSGKGLQTMPLLINPVSTASAFSQGVHIDCTVLVLFIFSPSSSAQPSFRPKALLLPVAKDQSTLQYTTVINQHIPLVPASVVFDLGGRELWVDCDKDYVSSTYQYPRCNYAECSRAGSTSCGTCFSPPTPGCRLASGTVGMARMGRHIISLPPQFAAAFSFSQKFAVYLSSGKAARNITRVASEKPFGDACFSTKNVGVTRLGYAAPEIQLLIRSNDVVWRIFRANSMTTSLPLTNLLVATTPSAHAPAPPAVAHVSLLPDLAVVTTLAAALQITNFIFDCGATFLLKGLASGTVCMARMGRHIIGLPPQFAAAFSFSQKFAVCLSSGKGLQTMPLLINPVSTASAFSQAARNITRVALEKPFGDACFSTKNVGVTRLGYAAPEIQLLLRSNDVVWRIFRANSMVSVSDDVICLGFIDGVNLCGVHIDCTILVLFIFSPSSSAQPSFRPKALLLPVAKDQSTLQYTTVINQHIPLVPASVVFDLAGRELWVDCDKDYVSSTYQSPRCNYAECSRAGSTSCGTCFSPPRPGCRLASGTVGMARMGRHIISLPPQFAAAFSFTQKFAVYLSSGKAARNITRVASEKPFGDACFSTKNVGVTRLGYAAPEIQLLIRSNDVVWRIFRANSMTTSLPLTNLLVATTPSAHAPAPPAVAHVSLLPDLAVVTTLAAALQITNFIFDCGATFLLKGLASGTVCMARMGRHIIGLPPQFAAAFSLSQKFAVCLSSGKGLQTMPLLINPVSTASAFSQAARNITRVALEKPFGDACFSTKNVGVTRLGYAAPEIQLLLRSNDVVWRIFRANSMVSVSDDVICLGFIDGVNLCGVHIDCTILVLFIFSPSSSAQPSFRPKALLLPVAKDQSTLQYTTVINQHIPLVPASVVFDLGGRELWVDCDKDYVSSTYQSPRCNYAEATFLLKGLASGTVCMARMGRHIIGLPPQFAAAFSFSQKFAVCLSSGKGLQTMPLLINPVSTASAFSQAARNITRVASEKPFGDACFSTKNVGVTRLGYAAPEIQLLLRSNDVVWRIFRANSMVSVSDDVICLGFVDGVNLCGDRRVPVER
ncbi:Aspartic peptidase domain superfamily [Arabidopsis suecica]|uniref:Aspartic peptidase domain superfamily n=1 Tax=Arabidopsis suecica TaxID=45249 RepID=A0A8T2BMR7_ARASU|nr:Aspartic peptidase domain superfamily [Arabidopsis suecica]